jgi:hypothetical protein
MVKNKNRLSSERQRRKYFRLELVLHKRLEMGLASLASFNPKSCQFGKFFAISHLCETGKTGKHSKHGWNEKSMRGMRIGITE